MSFMCMENNNGPRTVPCHTPATTGTQSDLTLIQLSELVSIMSNESKHFDHLSNKAARRKYCTVTSILWPLKGGGGQKQAKCMSFPGHFLKIFFGGGMGDNVFL